MEQKVTWMHYLIFGISSIFLLLTNGCKKDVDYTINAKWMYVNETNHYITYSPGDTWTEFNVSAHDTSFYFQNSDGPENMTVESFTPPINAQAVVVDNIKCDTLLADSLRVISSYEHKKLGERNYEFIFRFTEKNLSNALDCK
jgi:hypothetical protein